VYGYSLGPLTNSGNGLSVLTGNVFGISSEDRSCWFSMSVSPRPSIWRIPNRINCSIYCGSWAPIVPNLASDSWPNG
jgi:hypothetical protein